MKIPDRAAVKMSDLYRPALLRNVGSGIGPDHEQLIAGGQARPASSRTLGATAEPEMAGIGTFRPGAHQRPTWPELPQNRHRREVTVLTSSGSPCRLVADSRMET